MGPLVLLALAAPATGAAVRRWGPRALFAAAGVLAVALLWTLGRAGGAVAGQPWRQELPWAPDLGLVIALRLDSLALAVAVLVTGVGAAVLAYAARYFPAGDGAVPRSASVLVAFAAAMYGLVLVDNLLVLYVFWELTTVCSFLLIGHHHAEPAARRAARQALLVTTGFGLAMLVGFVLLGQRAGTYQISALVADPPRGPAVTLAAVLILLGAFAKAAQVPLHGWLPAAMVAPTPVSAYLHAAAMVKAGIYLVARLTPVFAPVPAWRWSAVGVGLASLLYGGWQALRQDDLKRLLAFGTISQLGLLTVLAAAGTRVAALALVALLLAHGLFKATLFLAVGVIDQHLGERRISRLAGAGRALPVVAGAAVLAGASMVGFPPLLGYVAKEAALSAFMHGGGLDLVVLVGVAAGSALTVAYTLRLLAGGFGGSARDTGSSADGHPSTGGTRVAKRPAAALVAAPAVLALAGLAGGLLASPVHRLAAGHAAAFPVAGEPGYELALWHGFGPPLVISALLLGTGAAGYAARRWLAPPVGDEPPAAPVLRRILWLVQVTARAVTRRIQVGSLPAYLMVILAVVVAVPGAGLLAGPLGSVTGRWSDNPMQLVLGVVALACAAGVVAARRRLVAVVLASGVGYAVTGLFALHGAPDLALTLLLVETLSLAMLVLLLRRQPATFPRPPRSVRRALRAGLAAALAGGAAALFVTLLLLGSGARRWPAVSDRLPELAREAGGHNLVNLLLADFRALDTLGEISVLTVTAIGVASLVAPASLRPDRDPPGGSGETEERREPPLGERSIALELTVRILVPPILVFAAYLLFAGHERPGGGFVAGLVAGTAYVLRYVAGGPRELRAAWPWRPTPFLGAGLVLALGTGIAGWLGTGDFLGNAHLTLRPPLLGEVALHTSLVFETGIAVLVLGLVVTLLYELGAVIGERGDPPGAPGRVVDEVGDDPAAPDTGSAGDRVPAVAGEPAPAAGPEVER
ncbi:hydrogen gas-evolving membrane-bound hydrogenase subunit E [Plantactinospora sp. WMMC1484]|uniref:hydrogen gas-evolving membrane-bound hydrogenase subunit E n=1 Tax=Plantactinospora sp. WMMC1484 TaxID=3404122 RepID=UPI003BF551FF